MINKAALAEAFKAGAEAVGTHAQNTAASAVAAALQTHLC